LDASLQILDKARQALEQATTFDDTKKIRDQAEAMQLYAKRQKYSVQCVNHCIEIKIRAERKLGQMLLQVGEQKAWKFPKTKREGLPTLEELGLDIGQSRDWQRLASLDDKDFEPWVERARSSGERLNVSFLLDLANNKLVKGKYRGQTPRKFILHLVSRIRKLQKAIERIGLEKATLTEQVPKEITNLEEALLSLETSMKTFRRQPL
jgi:hypothetical protein